MLSRQAIVLGSLGVLLAAGVAARLAVGDATGGIHWPESGEILSLRLARVYPALLVGASLAVAGVLLQALLRNPLASPDLIGATSGAGLGVAVSALGASIASAGDVMSAPVALQTVAALAGSLAALGLVLAWSVRRGGIDVVSLVLVGVIVGMVCSGLTLLCHHLMPDGGFAARVWLLGAINEDLSARALAGCAAIVAGAIALSVALARSLDTASLGDDEARSLGVRLGRLRLTLFLTAGLLTTVSVVCAGPIGFVGLIVPHGVRMLSGPHHRALILGAAIAGAATVVAADALVSALPLVLGGGRLPLGVVTAIAGGPLFLLLLRSTLAGRSL